MDHDHTDDDIEAQLRALLDESTIETIDLDDDSDNEVTLEENTEPLFGVHGVQDSQDVVNQNGEPIYIDYHDDILEALNLNNDTMYINGTNESVNVLNGNGEIVNIQGSDQPLDENDVIFIDTYDRPIYIDDTEETITIEDSDDAEEESKEPIFIQDSDDDSKSLTENKEPEKESEEKSNGNGEELSVKDLTESIKVSDTNEESSSEVSDGSHKPNESHESDSSESAEESTSSSSDSSSSEESTDTESESDESTNDQENSEKSMVIQEPDESSKNQEESVDIPDTDETSKALDEIDIPSSKPDCNEPQDEKLKELKKRKKHNRDKQDEDRKDDFNKSKMNKWFLAEFESHMGLKIGESDDRSGISTPLEESDSEKSNSSSSRRNRYSDDSNSDDSVDQWYSKQKNSKSSSSDKDSEYDEIQEIKTEKDVDEQFPNDYNVVYDYDAGGRNSEDSIRRRYTAETNSTSPMDIDNEYDLPQKIKTEKGEDDDFSNGYNVEYNYDAGARNSEDSIRQRYTAETNSSSSMAMDTEYGYPQKIKTEKGEVEYFPYTASGSVPDGPMPSMPFYDAAYRNSEDSMSQWYTKQTNFKSSSMEMDNDQTPKIKIEKGSPLPSMPLCDAGDWNSEDSMGRWYSKQSNSKSSSMDMDYEYDQTKKIKIEKGEDTLKTNNVGYGSMPILTGPLPSMPFYDAESHQFKMMETPKPPEAIQSPKSDEDKPEAKENKTDTSLDSENEEDLSDIETSSYFSSSSGSSSDVSDSEVIPKRKKNLSYWDDMSERPVDKGEITQEELQAILKDEEMLRRSERGSDSASDESEDEESNKDLNNINDGFDFYEDPMLFEDNREAFSFMVIKDDNIFDEYEQAVLRLFMMVSKVPSHHRFEIHLMVYPLLAITYLQMVASDNMLRATDFLDNKSCQLDESYSFRLAKLADVCTLEDIPTKARKLLAGYEKLELQMSRDAYRQLLFQLEEWPRGQQEKVLTHFHVLSYSEDEKPQQRPILGKQLHEMLYWAAPEPLHQKEFTIRPFLRGRRRKRNESPPRKNIHFPPGDRIFTPTTKRMDLVHRKNDEKHRMKLSRDSLPSAYLYTAPVADDAVLCATFSEAYTMIALGTLASKIYVFSLKPTKLVQLKSASLLEMLDTGMAGIDKGMLDPLKKYAKRTLVGHQGAVYSCCFNPEDRYLLSSSEDCSVRLWCLLSWSCLVIYSGSLSPVCHVTFAPLGYYFATASDDGMARIWTQDCRKPFRILEGHQAELTMCLFHPNRHYLATASADCTVRMWGVLNGSQIRLFRGHKRRISIITFSICGRYLVSGGDDNLIMIWDTALGRLIRYLDHHTAHINTMEFCLDNNLLVVGGQDCRLSIWDFERLLLDYQPSKVAKKRRASKDPLPIATQEELLISAYSTKNAPFYLIRFTRRNLLLGFCVSPDTSQKRERHQISHPLDEMKTATRKWFDFLDKAKLNGVCKSEFELHFPGVDEKDKPEDDAHPEKQVKKKKERSSGKSKRIH